VAGDTQHNENLALAVRCIGLGAIRSPETVFRDGGWVGKGNRPLLFNNCRLMLVR
jgi:hypothetical protein